MRVKGWNWLPVVLVMAGVISGSFFTRLTDRVEVTELRESIRRRYAQTDSNLQVQTNRTEAKLDKLEQKIDQAVVKGQDDRDDLKDSISNLAIAVSKLEARINREYR